MEQSKHGMKKGDRNREVELLQNRLLEMGFLLPLEAREQTPDGERLRYESGLFDHRTETALQAYQQAHGLEPSGILDKTTADAMNKVRCGYRRHQQFMLAGPFGGERKRSYTYSIDNYPVPREHDRTTNEQIRLAIGQAFATWAAVTDLSFSVVSSDGDIRIVFQDSLPIFYGCDLLGSVPLTNTVPSTGGSEVSFYYVQDCHQTQRWVYAETDQWPYTSYDLISVAIHEIGHALGLDHYPGGVMRESISDGAEARELTALDIRNIQELWGGPGVREIAGAHGAAASLLPSTDDLVQLRNTAAGASLLTKRRGTYSVIIPVASAHMSDGRPMALSSVLLRCKVYYRELVDGATTANTRLVDVAIWDGDRRLVVHRLDLDAEERPAGIQHWVLRLGLPAKTVLRSGLCLELRVFTEGDGRLDLISASGEYTLVPSTLPTDVYQPPM